MALGVMEGIQINEETILLNSGDYLVLYTDGLTEAVSFDGELYGDQRLVEILQNIDWGSLGTIPTDDGYPVSEPEGAELSGFALTASALIDRLDRSVSDFIGEAARQDDLTLLVLRRM